VQPGRPDRPPELTAEAAAEWDRIVPELDAAGVLSKVDRAALAAYCFAWGELVGATAILEEEGRIVREPMQNSRGEVIGEKVKNHPANRLMSDASARVKAYIVEFGLTPAARQRLGDPTAEAADGPGNKVLAIWDRIRAHRNGGAG
jgi:P27 family predicted phage terminase small subunit